MEIIRAVNAATLKSEEVGKSGADYVHISPIEGLSATTVQEALAELAARTAPAASQSSGPQEEG